VKNGITSARSSSYAHEFTIATIDWAHIKPPFRNCRLTPRFVTFWEFYVCRFERTTTTQNYDPEVHEKIAHTFSVPVCHFVSQAGTTDRLAHTRPRLNFHSNLNTTFINLTH